MASEPRQASSSERTTLDILRGRVLAQLERSEWCAPISAPLVTIGARRAAGRAGPGALAGDVQIVLAGEADHMGDALGAFDEGYGAGMLVGGEVPGGSRVVPIGVNRRRDAPADGQLSEVAHRGYFMPNAECWRASAARSAYGRALKLVHVDAELRFLQRRLAEL